ncbi:MAG: phosphotransferase, partial [Candidatus Eisenbacteria bacterium]|nr:phosphotransferase [Candidatus Eisenbacteria bacterium]
RAGPPCLIHRDLYPEQILVDDGRPGFIDLDELAAGEAELDLGNFIAHLHLTSHQRRCAAAPAQRQSLLLIETYERRRRLDRRRAAAYAAGSLLRLSSLNRLAYPEVSQVGWTDLAEALLETASQLLAARSPTA